jgi:hypothetical protein
MNKDTLHLLLSHDDDGSPVLKNGLPDVKASEPDEETAKAIDLPNFWDEGDNPDDLEAQRWGVFAPEGPEGDRLLALIRPLMEARREQQDAEVQVYRVPSGLSSTDAPRWRKTHFDSGKTSSAERPRYQLILGDLDRVSLSVQHTLNSDGFVGRLSFRNDRGYEAYVDKVLRWEKARAEAEASVKLFTVHDGTAATMIGYRALVKPGLDILRAEGYETADLGARDIPSPSEFFSTVKSPEPTILFSVSHGAGAPRAGWKSYEEQRDRQGAMSFGREGKITGSDINEDPFLPGGFWFMLACYGAGTPNSISSAYWPWLEKLKEAGQFSGQVQSVLTSLPQGDHPPFIAALPQAVLANPNGPLAVVGHIDLAWTYSFEERDTGSAVSRPAKFVDVLKSAMRAYRLGSSFRELARCLVNTNHELSELHDASVRSGGASDAARLGHLWMLRQDMAGYILLGDPAVRLPVRKRRAKPAMPEATSAPSIDTKVPEAKPAEPAPSPKAEAAPALPVDIDTLEAAIGNILAGRGVNEVADEFGIDRTVLRKLKGIYEKAGRKALGHS